MEIISSLENKKIKEISKLRQKKYRDIENKFIVEGKHLVDEAEKARVLLYVLQTEDYVSDLDVPVIYVTYDVIKKLSDAITPQKIIGVCKRLEKKEIGNKVLILDDIQDPGNLGTIIRSSLAFNIDTIILSNNSVDIYNEKVLRATEGMIFHLNIIRSDIKEEIKELKKDNYVIYGTKVTNGVNVRDVNKVSKYALVMGNEGNGVKEDILELCDVYLYIPMALGVESLNVGVATSIILYELGK